MLNHRARDAGFAVGVALIVSVAATSAYATDPTPKWCQGVKIAAFPGGPQGGVFANNVYNGFKQAELDLGPSVTYYFSDWDPNKMLTQIQQALATKVDGIATYGFGGEAATAPMVDQAFAQGTIFTTLNTSLPDSQKKYSAKGLRLRRRAQLFRRFRARRRSREARQPQGRRQRLRLGSEGPGRRPRPAHRRRASTPSPRPGRK